MFSGAVGAVAGKKAGEIVEKVVTNILDKDGKGKEGEEGGGSGIGDALGGLVGGGNDGGSGSGIGGALSGLVGGGNDGDGGSGIGGALSGFLK